LEKSADIHKAVASANELEYGVLLARDLGLLGESITQKLTDDTIEVRKMLFGFLKTI
jgi:four helix bundle protein